MSHRLDGKSVWYIMIGEGWHEIHKHGTTFHVSRRKDPYYTHNPYKVMYMRVFVLDMTTTSIPLYVLDSVHFPRWLESRGLAIQCRLGGGTEFYTHPDPVGLAKEFFTAYGIPILEEVDNDDEFPVHGDIDATARKVLDDEDCARADSKRAAAAAIATPHHDFLRVFIPGGALRKHQQELWEVWNTILESETDTYYSGIIQWPTATGKTFAMLILLLLTAQKWMRAGKVFRALLIAPQNGILDTLMTHIRKLSAFGIAVLEGHDGALRSLTIPTDTSFVLTATHAALTNRDVVDRLPPIAHIHYDEVHRITGELLFGILQEKIASWGTAYLTGTSATPKTSNKEQHRKIAELFGDPLTILHRAELEDMVERGYIARPRFHIAQIEKGPPETYAIAMVDQMMTLVGQRQTEGLWRGGKVILYLETLALVRIAHAIVKDKIPMDWRVYAAVSDVPREETDYQFLKDPADGTPRILFACEKFREGADVAGVEFTQILMGNTIAAYILLQIIGRALRVDYVNKEAWCCIMRPTTDDGASVLDGILLDLESMIQYKSGGLSTKDLAPFVRTYFGTVTINGRVLDVQETITHVQMLYLRRQIAPETSYRTAQSICREHRIADSTDYRRRQEHDLTSLPQDPVTYYKGFGWKGWHEFLHGSDRTISLEQFKTHVVQGLAIHTADDWGKAQGHYPQYPTLQHIHDGYFVGICEYRQIAETVRAGRR